MMKFHIQNNWHLDNLSLLIKSSDALFAADPIIFSRREPAALIEPCLQLSRDEAQLLLDELHRAGLRPSKAFGDVDATKYHLEDMRRLVFKDVKV